MSPLTIAECEAEWLAVPGRALEPRLALTLSVALDEESAGLIEEDIRTVVEAPIPGTIPIKHGAVVDAARGITLHFAGIPEDALRLDLVLAWLRAGGASFGTAIALHIIARIARTLSSIHACPGPARTIHRIEPESILLLAEGEPHLVACGMPRIDALLTACRRRPSPESERTVIDPRGMEHAAPHAAVRALASLYLELLSPRPAEQTTLAERLPDPRPTLLALFDHALVDEKPHFGSTEDFVQSALREAKCATVEHASRTLSRLLAEVDSPGARGAKTLFLPPGRALMDWTKVGEGTDLSPRAIHVRDRPAPRSRPPRTRATAPRQDAETPPRRLSLPKPDDLPFAPVRFPLSGEELVPARPPTHWKSATDPREVVRFAAIVGVFVIMLGVFASWLARRGAERSPPSGTERLPVAEAPDSALTTRTLPPPTETPAPGNLQPERGTVGIFSIMSQPSGASIEIDGQYVGVTPFVRNVPITQPQYSVRLTLQGYRSWVGVAHIDPTGRRLSLTATLERGTP